MKKLTKLLKIIVMIGLCSLSCNDSTNDNTSTNQTPVASDFNISNLTQTAGNVTAVTITSKEGKSTGYITIFYNSSETLPTSAGSYTVIFNVAASTGWNAANGLAGGTLTINAANKNPIAEDFEISNLTQTVGSVTAVTIIPKTGKSTGDITIFYNSSETLPTSAGSYTLTFNVAASTGWNAANGLVGGILTITNTKFVFGSSSVKLFLDDNPTPLQEGGTTAMTGTGLYIISIASGNYSEIIWYLNGINISQGTSNTSITLTKRSNNHVTVEVTAAGEKNSGNHFFMSVPLEITIAMWDSNSDGWDSNAALRINNNNGTNLSSNARLSSGSGPGNYTFTVNLGDIVTLYWVNGGQYDSECAYAVYYSEAPPVPPFNPNTNNWSSANNQNGRVLLYRQYNNSGSIGNGTLMGSFIVTGLN